MGYHLTILRTAHGRPSPISEAEVKDAAGSLPGWVFQDDGPSGARVTYSQDGGEVVTLWQRNGEWWTSTPPDAALQPMVDLADRLQARLRGDELETYRSADESYVHPDDLTEHTVSSAESRSAHNNPRRRKLIIAGLAACAGVILLRRCEQSSSASR